MDSHSRIQKLFAFEKGAEPLGPEKKVKATLIECSEGYNDTS